MLAKRFSLDFLPLPWKVAGASPTTLWHLEDAVD